MITKFLHGLEALVPLLMFAFTKRYPFCFGTPEQKVKTVNFDVCKKAHS